MLASAVVCGPQSAKNLAAPAKQGVEANKSIIPGKLSGDNCTLDRTPPDHVSLLKPFNTQRSRNGLTLPDPALPGGVKGRRASGPGEARPEEGKRISGLLLSTLKQKETAHDRGLKIPSKTTYRQQRHIAPTLKGCCDGLE